MQNFFTEKQQKKPPPPQLSTGAYTHSTQSGQHRCSNCGGPLHGVTFNDMFCSFDCMQSHAHAPPSPPKPPWKPGLSG